MSIQEAAAAIRNASAILIGAGAGMGVDSGLPDFRGREGFWRAYPLLRGKDFASISTPSWFESDPEFAWGFFGHRWNLYHRTTPHAGFSILKRWAEEKKEGYFVVTSNVDGHFQKSGYSPDLVFEIHGRINALQCSTPCCNDIEPAYDLDLVVDEAQLRCQSPLPRCPACHEVARPNILMFSDYGWVSDLSDEQGRRYSRWMSGIDVERLVVVELGAGTAISTIRYECESKGGTLIRINPRDSHGPPGTISIPLPALEALKKIDDALAS